MPYRFFVQSEISGQRTKLWENFDKKISLKIAKCSENLNIEYQLENKKRVNQQRYDGRNIEKKKKQKVSEKNRIEN